MSTYIKCVVQKEPEKPRDWSQPVDDELCYCSVCSDHQSLQQFLLEPKEECRNFTSLNNPTHLVCYMPFNCITSQASGVLTVTKTLKRWEREHEEWQERAFKVQETLKQFPQTELQQCLADQYEAIMNLDMLRITDISKRSIKDCSNGPSGFTVPQKRPRSETPWCQGGDLKNAAQQAYYGSVGRRIVTDMVEIDIDSIAVTFKPQRASWREWIGFLVCCKGAGRSEKHKANTEIPPLVARLLWDRALM